MSQVLNEFVSLESFGFMQDGSLLGYRLKDIEPELRCLIPRLDPSYVFEKDALSIMSAWFEIGWVSRCLSAARTARAKPAL